MQTIADAVYDGDVAAGSATPYPAEFGTFNSAKC
jgi:hypothetical protein